MAEQINMISSKPARSFKAEGDDLSNGAPTAEVTSHVASLRRYALVLVGDPNEADDLVQEALARVLSHMRAWRPVRDLRAYLFTTMHNVFIDSTRKRHNRSDHVPIDDVLGTLSLPATQPRRLEFRDLLQGLKALPVDKLEPHVLFGRDPLSGVAQLVAGGNNGVSLKLDEQLAAYSIRRPDLA